MIKYNPPPPPTQRFDFLANENSYLLPIGVDRKRQKILLGEEKAECATGGSLAQLCYLKNKGYSSSKFTFLPFSVGRT